jgi:hypothetical protein
MHIDPDKPGLLDLLRGEGEAVMQILAWALATAALGPPGAVCVQGEIRARQPKENPAEAGFSRGTTGRRDMCCCLWEVADIRPRADD